MFPNPMDSSELNGIQWEPGARNEPVDSPEWFPLYRKIRVVGKPLVLNGVKKEKVQKLLKELSPHGLLISTSCESEEEAYRLLQSLL